jgi:hypothetical protein
MKLILLVSSAALKQRIPPKEFRFFDYHFGFPSRLGKLG